jgi:CBS domain-containing protein
MVLQEILRRKGSQVHSIAPDATLEDVVRKLLDNNCGSLVVCEPAADGESSGTLAGIITERDILRACAAGRESLREVKVSDVMTPA